MTSPFGCVPRRTFRSLNGVMSYCSKTAYILHRIVHVEEHEIITRGDNCAYSDQPIQSSQVLGILTGYTHNGRERTVEDRSYRAYSRYIAMTTPVRLVYKRACIRLIELARAMQTRFNG